MEDEFALVPKPPSAVEKVQPGARRILSGMVADTLALTKKEQAALAGARFRIGEYQCCEPDYRQILLWAEALALKPQEVIERLLRWYAEGVPAESKLLIEILGEQTTIPDGSFQQLHWSLNMLPLKKFEWVRGLKVEHLDVHVKGKDRSGRNAPAEADLNLALPNLTHLFCGGIGLSKLDLSNVPSLQSINCENNRLRHIDLTLVPRLRVLRCFGNRLETTELSHVAELEKLSCFNNRLTVLDISMNKNLAYLDCRNNQLTDLDLSSVPNLTVLRCGMNNIRRLDIRSLENLFEFEYDAKKTRLIENPGQSSEIAEHYKRHRAVFDSVFRKTPNP